VQLCLTPVVGGDVSPLEDALGAGEGGRQLVLGLEHPVAGAGRVVGALAVALLQQVPAQGEGIARGEEGAPVETGLGGGLGRVVVRAEAELEVAHVVGGQLDPDLGYGEAMVDGGSRQCSVTRTILLLHYTATISTLLLHYTGTLIVCPFLYLRLITPRPY
jgi:hypothetical protein